MKEKYWTVANVITLSRVLLVPLIGWLLYIALAYNDSFYHWLSLAVFVVAALSDALDGWAARKLDQVSEFGALLDPIADKGLVLGVLFLLAYFGILGPVWLGFLLFLAFAIREIGMTLWRMNIIKNGGSVISARAFGKWKTTAQLLGIALLLTPVLDNLIGLILIYIALGLTYISAIDLLRSQKHNNESNRNS